MKAIMRYQRLSGFCLFLVVLAVSRSLAAQALGDEAVLSRLGDPVEIEIAVNDWQHLELGKIVVTNASRQQYEAFKLTYSPLLESLSFNVVGPNSAGLVKILVSSRKPVTEPYMDLLVVLKWPAGSSMREYVLLFDPPQPNFSGAGEPRQRSPLPTDQPQSKAVPSTSTAQPPPKEPARQLAVKPANVPKPVQPDVRTQTAIEVQKVSATQTPVVDDGRRQYRVRNGDSLWNIARQFHPAGIGENLYQFLISLHDLNRDAFINGNISLLKADAQLHIPSARDIAAINPGSAQAVFEQLWREGVRSPEVTASDQPAPQFKPLNESPEPRPQPVAPAPRLPAGTEQQPKTAVASGPLLPASASLIAAQTDQNAPAQVSSNKPEPAPPPVIQVVPRQTRGASVPGGATMESNPYLQKINESATAIQSMLEVRRQRMAALEEQILAMQNLLE